MIRIHFQTRFLAPLTVLIYFLAALTPDLCASPVFSNVSNGLTTPSNNTDELAYTADVSTTDLLHGIVGTGGSWNTTPAPNVGGLNDGTHGGDSNVNVSTALTGSAWAKNGSSVSSRDFVLGTGANGLGYNITGIQSIAAWQGAGFQNQKYDVFVSTVASSSFTLLTTVDFQPSTSTAANTDQGGSTKVNVTDTTGFLASGIDAIRFNVLDTVGHNNGGTVFREIDVFGTETAPDLTPPTLNTLTSVVPADGATGVAISSNFVATFSEPIALTGSGGITLKNLSGGADIAVALPGEVAIVGAALTINPASNLVNGQDYAVEISANTFKDLATIPNLYTGLLSADVPNWSFTAAPPDTTPPTLNTLTSVVPADNATNVPIASNLVATFNENIALGSGTITIKDLDTPAQTVAITLPDARVTVSGAVLTINPSANLAPSTDYALQVGPGAINDIAGNPFTGIANDTIWNFTTASAPLRIMCLGDSITAGYTDNPGWVNHPFEFGYRSGLYTLLTNCGYNFLFVGGSTEPWTGISGDPTQGGTYTPPLDLRTFGQDGHRGYGGTTASGLQGNIVSWLNSDNPDIILLKIGTNSQNTNNLDTLVNTITTTKPNARLIIAQIMPKYTYQAGIVTYNDYIRNTLVPAQQGLGRNVTMVDQYAPFLTNPAVLTSIDQSLFSNGINHPDNDGYDKMAQVWLTGIDSLGLGTNTFAKWINDFPGVGAQTGFTQDADGDGIKNGVENFFGTNPSAFSPGLVSGVVNKVSGTYTFTHPQNATPATDLNAAYRWSKDLLSFQADGAAHGGTTVTFSTSVNTPSLGTTTVTATVTGTAIDKLFVDVVVTSN